MYRRYGRKRGTRRKYGRRMYRKRTSRYSRLAKKVKEITKNSTVTKIACNSFSQTLGGATVGVHVTVTNICDLNGYSHLFPVGASKLSNTTSLAGTADQTITWKKINVHGFLDRGNELDAGVYTAVAFVVPRRSKLDSVPTATNCTILNDGRIYMDPADWKILYQKGLVNIHDHKVHHNAAGPGGGMLAVANYNMRTKINFTKTFRGGKSVSVNANGTPLMNRNNIYMITVTNNTSLDFQDPAFVGNMYIRYTDGSA